MGLLVGLLTLPLAPVRGVAWLADQVHLQAERELHNRELISERLVEVERRKESGEISEAESAELEEQILDELEW